MKTYKNYLTKAKEIRDVAQWAKKAIQPTTTRAGASITSKKRKCLVAPGGPSEPRIPEVTLVPSTSVAAPVTISVVDLDDAEGHSSPYSWSPCRDLPAGYSNHLQCPHRGGSYSCNSSGSFHGPRVPSSITMALTSAPPDSSSTPT